MTILKFRAWSPSNKKMQTTSDQWAGDVFIRLNGEKVICIDTGEWEEGMTTDFAKDNLNLVLMQFTELQDRNDKDIYEGDIVEYIYQNTRVLGIVMPINHYGVCIFNDRVVAERSAPKWQNIRLMDDGNKGPLGDEDDDCVDCDLVEIVGNIYQNPELLKV